MEIIQKKKILKKKKGIIYMEEAKEIKVEVEGEVEKMEMKNLEEIELIPN